MKAIVTVSAGPRRRRHRLRLRPARSTTSTFSTSARPSLEQGYFAMVPAGGHFRVHGILPEIADKLDTYGTERGLAVRIQREDIFNAMHRI